MIFLEPCSNKQLKVVFIRIILLKRFILRGVLVFCVKTAHRDFTISYIYYSFVIV